MTGSTSFVIPQLPSDGNAPAFLDNGAKEKCLLICVGVKTIDNRPAHEVTSTTSLFSTSESMKELTELVRTAGMQAMGYCIQRLRNPFAATYIGTGKVAEIIDLVSQTGARTLVFDDDLTPKQQRNLEDMFKSATAANSVKIVDRTAVILEIFAQHAKSKEGQLQVIYRANY